MKIIGYMTIMMITLMLSCHTNHKAAQTRAASDSKVLLIDGIAVMRLVRK